MRGPVNTKGDPRIAAELRFALMREHNPNRTKPRMVWDFNAGKVRLEVK